MIHFQMEKLMDELQTLSSMPGLLMTDLLELPEATRQFLQWILRQKEVEIKEIAGTIEQPESSARTLADGLVHRGMLEHVSHVEGDYYRVRMRAQTATLRRSPHEDLWKSLDDTTSSDDPQSPKGL